MVPRVHHTHWDISSPLGPHWARSWAGLPTQPLPGSDLKKARTVGRSWMRVRMDATLPHSSLHVRARRTPLCEHTLRSGVSLTRRC